MTKTKLEKKERKVIEILNEVTPKLTGKLEGDYWIWPTGLKTAIRFIKQAASRYRPLPRGFYDAVEKSNRTDLKMLVATAKKNKIKDSDDG